MLVDDGEDGNSGIIHNVPLFEDIAAGINPYNEHTDDDEIATFDDGMPLVPDIGILNNDDRSSGNIYGSSLIILSELQPV